MGIVVRLLLLCRLRHRFCHLLVVVAVAAVVVIFVIVIVVVANVVIVVVAIVVLRVRVEHAVEGRVAGVVELDGVRGCSRLLPTPEGGRWECAIASVGGPVRRSRRRSRGRGHLRRNTRRPRTSTHRGAGGGRWSGSTRTPP